eukprot:m.261588 g.261588  ORF g.261588 m.261588 type:complete len:314 (-) comp54613_c0_seq2:894-1835(-)
MVGQGIFGTGGGEAANIGDHRAGLTERYARQSQDEQRGLHRERDSTGEARQSASPSATRRRQEVSVNASAMGQHVSQNSRSGVGAGVPAWHVCARNGALVVEPHSKNTTSIQVRRQDTHHAHNSYFRSVDLAELGAVDGAVDVGLTDNAEVGFADAADVEAADEGFVEDALAEAGLSPLEPLADDDLPFFPLAEDLDVFALSARRTLSPRQYACISRAAFTIICTSRSAASRFSRCILRSSRIALYSTSSSANFFSSSVSCCCSWENCFCTSSSSCCFSNISLSYLAIQFSTSFSILFSRLRSAASLSRCLNC